MTVLPPTTTQDDVTKALDEVATPAVSGPVTVAGEDVTGTISPEVIASALSFRADAGPGPRPGAEQGGRREGRSTRSSRRPSSPAGTRR